MKKDHVVQPATLDDLMNAINASLPLPKGETAAIPIGAVFPNWIIQKAEKALQGAGYHFSHSGKGNGRILRIAHPAEKIPQLSPRARQRTRAELSFAGG